MEKFKTVRIQNQVWMVENLNLATYRNGDPVLHAENVDQWKEYGAKGKGCWCYYKYKESNGRKYGKLYHWYAVHDPRFLAAAGFRIPTEKEFKLLVDNLGGWNDGRKKLLSSKGFAALNGGWCDWEGMMSEDSINFWSATIDPESDTAAFALGIYKKNVEFGFDYIVGGYYVRCIEGEEKSGENMTLQI